MSSYYALKIPRCEHVKDNGVRCGAPAMRSKPFCYHHIDVHATRLKVGYKGYKFRPIESGESVTMQVAEIAQAAHDGAISLPLARVLLYAIQIGARHMKDLEPAASNVETEMTSAMEAAKASEHLNIGSSEEGMPSEQLNIGTAEEKSGTSEETINNTQSPMNNPTTTEIVTDYSEDRFAGCSDDQMIRSSDDPMAGSPDDQIRNSIFHLDPVVVRAYWTQHLPPKIADLRGPNGELVYTPPEWLPLTEQQLEYLRDRLGPNDMRLASPEERENMERMTLHCTHMMVKPPQPEEIVKCYNDLWNSDRMWKDLDAQIKKDPKAAAKMLMEQIS